MVSPVSRTRRSSSGQQLLAEHLGDSFEQWLAEHIASAHHFDRTRVDIFEDEIRTAQEVYDRGNLAQERVHPQTLTLHRLLRARVLELRAHPRQ